jgi:FixJ family two-component response regulator
MGFLTERERKILLMLKEEKSVRDIAKKLNVSDSSLSRSISNIRIKAMELEDDIKFFQEIGFVKIKDGKIDFISRDKDPKILGKA